MGLRCLLFACAAAVGSCGDGGFRLTLDIWDYSDATVLVDGEEPAVEPPPSVLARHYVVDRWFLSYAEALRSAPSRVEVVFPGQEPKLLLVPIGACRNADPAYIGTLEQEIREIHIPQNGFPEFGSTYVCAGDEGATGTTVNFLGRPAMLRP